MTLFGTNGVRGKLDALSPSLVFDLSVSFASRCGSGKILLARDMRLTSPMLHASAKAGVLAAGKDVLDIGIASSPVAEFTLSRQKAAGLIIVTASHNPPEWNALKFVDAKGVAISRERGEGIERIALAKKYPLAKWNGVGKAEMMNDAAQQHEAALISSIDSGKIRKKKPRVVLDFGNGTSSLSAGVFASLGCEVFAINEKMDGSFPGRSSEPSEPNVQKMLHAVKENSADFGVAWDGDSDRVVFADEKGNWIVGDKGFAISAVQACREVGEKKKKVVVTTVATSRAVEDACAALGAKTEYTKVGAPYLSEKMVELGGAAVSGGEEVGGIIWPRFSLAKDGIFAAAKICEMVCEKKISEYLSELPVYYNSKAKPEATPEKKAAGLSAAKKHAKGSGGRLTLIDGVRSDFEDGWVIVRASGTENAMRIFAEATGRKKAEQLMKEYAEVVTRAISE